MAEIDSPYITDKQFCSVLNALSIELKSDDDRQELIDRAVGEFEGDMVERYVVPLICQGAGLFSAAPAFSQAVVLNCLKSKLRHLIGTDKNRNVILEAGQRFIDLHEAEYTRNKKSLLDPKRTFGFQLNEGADGAVVPIQTIGLAKSDNELHTTRDVRDIVY